MVPENLLTRNAVTKLNAAMVTATFQSPRMLWESKRMTAFSTLAFSTPVSATRHIHTEATGSSMANTHWASTGTKCVSAFSVDPPDVGQQQVNHRMVQIELRVERAPLQV